MNKKEKKQVNSFNEVANDVTTVKKEKKNISISQETSKIESTDKLEKSKVFADVKTFLFPLSFDDSDIRKNYGFLPEDVFTIILDAKRKEFEKAHKDEIQKFENLNFETVVARLQENKQLLQNLLSVCGVSELKKENYINSRNEVIIYHSIQNEKNEYTKQTLKETFNGKEFITEVFVEYLPQTTTNILRSIRYFNILLDAKKRLLNQTKDVKRILWTLEEMTIKAKENGFTLETIQERITRIFAH